MLTSLRQQSQRSSSWTLRDEKDNVPLCFTSLLEASKCGSVSTEVTVSCTWPMFTGHTCPFGSGSSSSGSTRCQFSLLPSHDLDLGVESSFEVQAALSLTARTFSGVSFSRPVVCAQLGTPQSSRHGVGQQSGTLPLVYPWLHGHKGKGSPVSTCQEH